MTVIDTTVGLSTAQIAGLRAAGVTAVSRYIAPQAWKRITPDEYRRILAGGLQVSLNWESGARDLYTVGTSTTADYARQAVAQVQACGYPAGCVILNSADWDVQAAEWPTVAARLRTIRPIYRAAGYGLGLYAPWDALGWAQRDGLVDVYWQAGMSTAWSGRRNANAWPGAHLRQRRNAVIAGVDCDTNDILIAQFGQAGPGGSAITPSSTGADMELNTQIPGSGYGSTPKTLDLRLALIDLTKALDPYDASSWQNEQLRNTRALLAGQAAAEKRDTAFAAALQALTAGGTSVDTAAVIAHIDQATTLETTAMAALHEELTAARAEVADLRAKLAAAGGALAQ
jgi:hypothetical protein